jgi:transcriptional regulator with XRE-family HTH domain
MDTRNNKFKLDFMPIGQDIKRAREARDVTREQLSEVIDYAPRHIQAIENEGQTPSVDLLFQLAEMFDISLDRRIFKDRDNVKSSIRRRMDTLLDGLADKDLIIVEAVIKGIHQANEMPEE